MAPQRDGLDFTTFDLELKAAAVKKKREIEVFRDIKVMERSALATWCKLQK